MLKNIIKCFFLVLFISCTGTIQESWRVEDFSKPHTFTIEVPESKKVSNVNVYLKGDFTGTIYLSTVEGDSTLQYNSQTLPKDRIFMDFYGGEYNLYLAPSDAIGELIVAIKIPYGP